MKHAVDPHTADRVSAAHKLHSLLRNNEVITTIVMGTALSVKFDQTMTEALGGSKPSRPDRFRGIEDLVRKNAFTVFHSETEFRDYLLAHDQV